MLNPRTLLNYKRFYAAVTDLQISFANDHKIAWAPLNHPLLLFRYLKELALPLELYDVTIRLSKLLGYEFVLRQDGKKRLGVRHLPEAQLAGCLVVCVKLLYPFDGEQRHPHSAAEPTAAVIDWRHWHECLLSVKEEQRGDGQRYTVEQLIQLEETDVFEMTYDHLDQYLDFYADAFLDDVEVQRTKDTDDFRNAIYGMFPIERANAATTDQTPSGLSSKDDLAMVRAVHGSMQAVSAVEDAEEVLRPGQLYRSYKTKNDMPENAKQFYEEIAKLAGLTIDMLLMAVFFTEARIEKRRRKQREAEKQDQSVG
jgi:RNA polymerase I-specific transcription initiation factor RRN7